MATTYCKRHKITQTQYGFTLIELMIVIAIIGVMSAIAYPSYQQYVIKTKRTEMMGEMHNIASEIQARKLAQGSYNNNLKSGLTGDYPRQGSALYSVTIEPIVVPPKPLPPAPTPPTMLNAEWIITATPIIGTQMANDGSMTLNYLGVKCRVIKTVNTCGINDEWNR
ncbi:MAG: prepilin-type N-terminal cleavage/methylation domain-containing protein [Psychrobacter sp.]